MDTVSAKILWPRVVLGFVIAPLIVPVSYYIFNAASERNHGSVSEFIGTLLTYGPYAYLFAVLLGIPAFWLLRRSGHAGVWSYALATAAIGLIGAGLLSIIGLKTEGIIVGTVAGALAGIVFYLVAGLLS
jgi:hypothetical protein